MRFAAKYRLLYDCVKRRYGAPECPDRHIPGRGERTPAAPTLVGRSINSSELALRLQHPKTE